MPTRKQMAIIAATTATALSYLGIYHESKKLNSNIGRQLGAGANLTNSIVIDGEKLFPREIIFENKTETLNPYGAKEAINRHEILKELGLIPLKSEPITTVPVTVSTNSSLSHKNIDLEGYIVSPHHHSEATPEQKTDFIKKNLIGLMSAGLLGIDFRALRNKIVNVNGTTTLLEDHTVGTPTILYEAQKSFKNSTDTENSFSRKIEPETKIMADTIYHHDATFKKLQVQRLESILKNYGADSEIYKIYVENYKKIEEFFKSDKSFLDVEHYVFKDIKSIRAQEINGKEQIIAYPDSYDLRSQNGENPSLQNPHVLNSKTDGVPLLPKQKQSRLIEEHDDSRVNKPSSSPNAPIDLIKNEVTRGRD
jgi:hypothetical protein